MDRTRLRRTDRLLLCLVVLVSSVAVAADDPPGAAIRLTSPVVEPGGPLPVDHTQLGLDVSPPLAWAGLPDGTRELALIFDGPYDVQPEPFVHWVVYDIPAKVSGLDQGLVMDAVLRQPAGLAGVRQGLTGWDSPGYRGPWPTRQPEIYAFTLYALDADLELPTDLDRDALLAAISGHVLGTGELRVVSQARGFQ